ncbi:MAG: hypothetical protein JNL12_15580 [Planctomycetes bacterium]|nr:hypothetical protein [Planctomycetota bacterium]
MQDERDPATAAPDSFDSAPPCDPCQPRLPEPSAKHRRRTRWLTVAALLVTAGLTAAIALPRHFRARLSNNESTVIATLKNISSGQSQLQACGAQDADGDGQGEYGFLGQLAGVTPLRGSDALLTPPVLPSRFGEVRDGRVEIGGYVIEMFLPAKDGGWVSEAMQGAGGGEVDDDAAENVWLCYAWPVEHGWTGKRAFLVDHRGDVLASNMPKELYSGRIAPKAGQAGHCATDGQCRPAANTVDHCGNLWVVI